MSLASARVLVADDQVDVARTLCYPLRASGATLDFVTSGPQALEKLHAGTYDMCIADMAMEPAPWGGLWLLREMHESGLRIPVVVLSGEGGQRQTIEAMRLGAGDWVDKANATEELAARSAQLLERRTAEVWRTIADALPFPLSVAFARYADSIGSALQLSSALSTLEECARTAALVCLASRDKNSESLGTVFAQRLARPSFGTWVDVGREALRRSSHPIAATLVRSLGLDNRAEVDEYVRVRNDLQHGGAEPSREVSTRLAAFLDRAASRVYAAWPHQIATPRAFEWDGSSFHTEASYPSGTGTARTFTLESTAPLRSGRPVLHVGGGAVFGLWPWITSAASPDSPVEELLVFEGVLTRSTGAPKDDDRLSYSSPMSRTRRLMPVGGGCWGDIRRHFDVDT